MRDLSSVGDLNHDGHADAMAIRKSDGCLYLYSGRGNGTLGSSAKVSCGWGSYDQITGAGDFNRDGHADWPAAPPTARCSSTRATARAGRSAAPRSARAGTR